MDLGRVAASLGRSSTARASFEAKSGLSLGDFDAVIVFFSGGKDSLASALLMKDLGIEPELWHHEVDEPGQPFMDWPCTHGYCTAVANELDLPLYFSRRKGGFLRELRRDKTPTAPVVFDTPQGTLETAPSLRPSSVQRRFPALGAIESGRWCSAVLKIDVARRVFNNDPRLRSGRFLVVSGERREEGGRRSSYKEVEENALTNRRRQVIQWRNVIDWSEEEIWSIIRRHGIRPHVAYELGWHRLSCAACIFGGKDQFASVQSLLPDQFKKIASEERKTGATIKPPPRKNGAKGFSIVQFAQRGDAFDELKKPDPRLVRVARSPGAYRLPIRTRDWIMPAGAFKGGQGGPT